MAGARPAGPASVRRRPTRPPGVLLDQAGGSGERKATRFEHLPHRVHYEAEAFKRMSAEKRPTIRAGEEHQRECCSVTIADLDPRRRLLPGGTVGEDHWHLPVRGDAEPSEQGIGEL
jgi:hypothetical protein